MPSVLHEGCRKRFSHKQLASHIIRVRVSVRVRVSSRKQRASRIIHFVRFQVLERTVSGLRRLLKSTKEDDQEQAGLGFQLGLGLGLGLGFGLGFMFW